MSRTGRTAILVGWLFMVPPPGETDAPIERWIQLSAYDTAAECETFKSRWYESVLRGARRADGELDEKAFLRLYRAGSFHARCVPAQAVYPRQ